MQEEFQRALEVSKADTLVDDEAFHLREHRGMRGIVLIAAVNTARGNHANRLIGFVSLHGTRLYRRSLGTHENFISNIEGILHIARRMVLGQVQRLKVEVIALNFRTFFHAKAHVDKDILNTLHGQRQRVQMALRHRAPRQRNINLFTGQSCRHFLGFEFASLGIDSLFHFCFGNVDNLADFRTFLSRQAAHATQNSGEFPLLA